MEYYSDKNNLLQHLKKGMMELIDNTLCYDFDWKADYFEQAKEEIEEAENIHKLRYLFEVFYNYVRSVEDDEDWIEQFQEFGHDELEVRLCEKCGCMMVQGFKEKWHDYYTDDGEDCWTQWEC